MCQDDVRRECNQLCRVFANSSGVARRPTRLDSHVLAEAPTRLLHPLQKRPKPRLKFRIIRCRSQDHADPSHALGLLRMKPKRQSSRRARNNSDKIPPPHSITSLARASKDGGTLIPSAFAVLRL